MLNKIIHFSLQNRLLVLVASALLFVAGIYCTVNAEIDVFPDLNAPTVVVMTEANGMAAEEVECRLTGTGSAYCSPLSKLKIRGIGTGKVYYRGNPEKIEKSGLTTVKAVKDEGDPASVTVEEKPATEVKPEPLTTPSVVDDVFEGGEDDDATEGRKPVQRPDAPAINSI